MLNLPVISPHRRSDGTRELRMEIFKNTSITEALRFWRAIAMDYQRWALGRKRLAGRGGGQVTPPSVRLEKDSGRGGRILIAVLRDTTEKNLRQAWPTVRKLQKKLAGEGRHRFKKKLERDKTALMLKARGMSSQKILNEMPLPTDPTAPDDAVNPEAFRQAISRLNRRLK